MNPSPSPITWNVRRVMSSFVVAEAGSNGVAPL